MASGSQCPTIRGRAVVDTAPLLERDFARLAGLGWIGKNTMLISRRLGSFTFLGALLVDAELAYDTPHAPNHCGTLHALPRRLPHPGVRSDRTSSTPGAASVTGRSSTEACSPTKMRPSSMAGSSAATSARMSVPGTARPRRDAMAELDARPEWSDPDLIEWLTRDAAEWKSQAQGNGPGPDQTRGALAQCRTGARRAGLDRGGRRPWRPASTIRTKTRRCGPRRPGRWAGSARTKLRPLWRGTTMIRNHWSATPHVAPGTKVNAEANKRKGGPRKTLVSRGPPWRFSSAHPPCRRTCDQVAAARQPDHEFH